MRRWTRGDYLQLGISGLDCRLDHDFDREEADIFARELCDTLQMRRQSPRYDGDRIGLEVYYGHSVATGNYGCNTSSPFEFVLTRKPKGERECVYCDTYAWRRDFTLTECASCDEHGPCKYCLRLYAASDE